MRVPGVSQGRLFAAQMALVVERRFAHIDADNPCAGIVVGDDCGLVCATACYQYVNIWPEIPVGPEKPVGVFWVEPLPVVHKPSIQILYRLRVLPFLVLLRDDINLWTKFHLFWFRLHATHDAVIQRSTRNLLQLLLYRVSLM